MAKRKRLTPAEINALEPGTQRAPANKSLGSYPLGGAPPVATRAPIAQVAAETAAQAALQEVVNEMQSAKAEGRMLQSIALDAIDADHLVRDRMVSDADEMDVLKTSLKARGQQIPIEVVDLDEGRFGLISGWRRLSAFKELYLESNAEKFAKIECLLRRPDTAADAYQSMIEENEVRVGLSYYERARIAAMAAKQGVYPTAQLAVRGLFVSASRSKRSKIMSFLILHDALGDTLRFPSGLGERVGLSLAKAMQEDVGLGEQLKVTLRSLKPANVREEQAMVQDVMAKPTNARAVQLKSTEILPGMRLVVGRQKFNLTGPQVTEKLIGELQAWLQRRGP